MRITDVIRAEEWISSTPKHVLLYKAFGWKLPKFWHMPLLRNIDKSKISKRKNPVSLIFYRQAGYLPEALLNFLGLMGGGMPQTSGTIEDKTKAATADMFDLPGMIERFSFAKISLGGPVFDLVKLKWLNGEYLRALSESAFFDRMRETVFSDAFLREIVPLVQTRVETMGQVGDLTDFLFSDNVMPSADVFVPKKRTIEETVAFAGEMLAVLEAAEWTVAAIEPAMKELGVAKEWSVKENFMLLRAILTGKTASPPLLESLIVFGKARSLDRVRRFVDGQKKMLNQRK
jgi:glutamyl-tRNA synthetase